MAVVFVSAEMNRSATLPTILSSTIMCWALASTVPLANNGIFSIGANGGTFYAPMITSANRLKLWNGSAESSAGTIAFTSGVWFHVAMTCAGTGANLLKGYINGVLDVTTTAASGATNAWMIVGNTDGGDAWTGRVGAMKLYSRVLTADEIKIEAQSHLPVSTNGLNSWYPLLTHTTLAQYGPTWTASGTLSTGLGPPIPWSTGGREGHIGVASEPPLEELIAGSLMLSGVGL